MLFVDIAIGPQMEHHKVGRFVLCEKLLKHSEPLARLSPHCGIDIHIGERAQQRTARTQHHRITQNQCALPVGIKPRVAGVKPCCTVPCSLGGLFGYGPHILPSVRRAGGLGIRHIGVDGIACAQHKGECQRDTAALSAARRRRIFPWQLGEPVRTFGCQTGHHQALCGHPEIRGVLRIDPDKNRPMPQVERIRARADPTNQIARMFHHGPFELHERSRVGHQHNHQGAAAGKQSESAQVHKRNLVVPIPPHPQQGTEDPQGQGNAYAGIAAKRQRPARVGFGVPKKRQASADEKTHHMGIRSKIHPARVRTFHLVGIPIGHQQGAEQRQGQAYKAQYLA